MDKLMYSEDIIWYDPVVKIAIEKLAEEHSNAIPVFASALSASQYATTDFEKFVSFIPTVIEDAEFFGWHAGIISAIKTFCHLCFVDPDLVEAYLGMSFMQLLEV